MVLSALSNKAATVGQPAVGLLTTLQVLAGNTIKSQGFGEVIGYAVRSVSGDKAKQTFFTTVGTQLALIGTTVLAGGIPGAGAAATLLFAVVIYFTEAEMHQRKAKNAALAKKLFENLIQIRQDKLQQLQEKSEQMFQQQFLSGAKTDAKDEVLYGTYQYPGEQQVLVHHADIVAVRSVLEWATEQKVSDGDIMHALAEARIVPRTQGTRARAPRER